MTAANLPLIAVTMGDPAGVGPEIIVKALGDSRVQQCCQPIVYGDADRLQMGAASSAIDLTLRQYASITEVEKDAPGVKVVNGDSVATRHLAWSAASAEGGRAMAGYLRRAIDDALAGRIAAIATGPINKQALKMAGIEESGHTEILARRTGTRTYAMMLTGARLKVVLASIHLPIREVPAALDAERIVAVIGLTDQALKDRFGLKAPRIAVAGLNPHAGEGGLFGDEEAAFISPAVTRAAARGIRVSGPHPADTVFFRAAHGDFDAVVAMYHDQGLGPFKMIHFDDGVNTTLGLPFVRTSVDHGTAYDIAGTGRASAMSMVAAIIMAARQAACLHQVQVRRRGGDKEVMIDPHRSDPDVQPHRPVIL